MKHDTWRVAYWCVKIQRSSILKSGTESDIAKLPAGKGKNKARQQRTRVNDEGREVKCRRIKKTRTPAVIENDVDDAPPLDGTTITGFVPIIRPVTQEEAEIQQQHTNESSLIEIDLDNTQEQNERRQTTSVVRRNVRTRNQQVHNNVGNDFTTAFSGIQDEFIDLAEASSQPPPDATLPAVALRGPTKPGMCAGCGLPVCNIHRCDVCKHNMHVYCGIGIGEEGFGQKIRCLSCQRSLDT